MGFVEGPRLMWAVEGLGAGAASHPLAGLDLLPTVVSWAVLLGPRIVVPFLQVDFTLSGHSYRAARRDLCFLCSDVALPAVTTTAARPQPLFKY